MIDFISGVIKHIREKTITLLVGGFGITVMVPKPSEFILDEMITLHTYVHWNQDQGFTLYGFKTELTRTVFLMIIDCPKIGPSIALNILSQVNINDFLTIISSQNEKALSSLNGIGPKKAEQLIVELKHKVPKLLESGNIVFEEQQNFAALHNISEVLTSLNYSKPEVNKALQFLAAKYSNQNSSLDQLIRAALSYLATKP